jgi:hypothetical protein
MQLSKKPGFRIPLLLAVILLLTTALGGFVAAETSANHAKTQVLLYLVGSDLETKSATGTFDLNDIVTSYGDTNAKDLDVIVAFGGANKEGWKGMNIATIEQLKVDAKDEKFGNGQYLYSDTSADMGSGKSLRKFLTEVEKVRTADKSIFIISDHGNSYDGIGTDDISKNTLKMGDISDAFHESGLSNPPIIFDACLMSSVEVGKTVQPHTRLMLGSEEMQRGSYNYKNVIKPLTETPTLDPKTLMTKIADAYIDDKDPAKAKTASIIDVTKIKMVRDSLDILGVELDTISDTKEGLHDLKGAYNGAVRLGVSNGGEPTSVDLVSLLENIEKKRPELKTDVQTAILAVKDAVVYERHNSYSPTVAGLSIASPDAMTLDQYNKYGDVVKVAPYWDKFFKKMIVASHSSSSSDSDVAAPSPISKSISETATTTSRPHDEVTTKPEDKTETPSSTTATSEHPTTTTTTQPHDEVTAKPEEKTDSPAQKQTVNATPTMENETDKVDSTNLQEKHPVPDKKSTLGNPRFISRGNGTYELDDPYRDASVYESFYRVNGSHALSIGTRPILPGSDGLYQLPAWDGRWYYFPDHTTSRGSIWDQITSFFANPGSKPQPLLVDMDYEDVTSGGYTEYSSWISIQDKYGSTDATLITYVNSSNNKCEIMIVPYTQTKDGGAVFGGDMDQFRTGSRVTSYTSGFDVKTQKQGEYTLSQGSAGPATTIEYAMLPDGTYAAGFQAYYDNDDVTLTDQFRIITIRNGAVISSKVGPLR